MKDKFIRIISPVSLIFAVLFDAAAIYLSVYEAENFTLPMKRSEIIFIIICVLALVLAVIITREVTRHGIIFREGEMEFTALDENNIFSFDNIESFECIKDTKASFKKNYVDRYSSLIIYLKDNSVATIELGFTTRKKLQKIQDEIKKRA